MKSKLEKVFENNFILDGRGTFSGSTLLYLIIGACGLTVVTIAVVVTILCCRRQDTHSSPQNVKKCHQKSNQHIKPPDLWIHHDQMELKALEKSHSANDGASSSGAMTLPRSVGANEYDAHDGHHSNSLDKRTYVPNYMGKLIFVYFTRSSVDKLGKKKVKMFYLYSTTMQI